MGNSSSKDERRPSRDNGLRHVSSQSAPGATSPPASQTPADRLTAQIYGARSGSGRGSRHDLSFLTLGHRSDDAPASERPRETRQEREARRAERERQARVKERERSLREEGVDGGYLVTLGTYTGPEDFNKGIVRQLQVERRLAPFWKGLNDHSDSWTEAQLVAAVRGLPIPAADEIPPDMARTGSQMSSNAGASSTNVNQLTIPITARSQSNQSDASANLSASHPAFSTSGLTSSASPSTSSAALLRGRAKTLASLATGSKNSSDLTPQEVNLPKDPYVNGLPLEAYLYREPCECPICFLYYPPYLNKTRCCDQPICSECFVQIKRPDPHPPEHEQPGQPRPPEEEAELLVSEVAACPFCVTPEFGVSYDPPPFRRGLAYANQANGHPLRSLNSAMSSSSSLTSGGGRRRATSLSASSPQVITTDKVRPDWAKKLADARAHALRRSAAATALHNAAYMLGNPADGQSRGALSFGRRRRALFIDNPGASGSGTPRLPEDGSTDPYAGRTGSRRNRVEDLEDLMMMEAIRLSLAAEEDRKRREDKEIRKEEKKKAKEEKKQAKQAEKLAKKRGDSNASLYPVGTNDSTSTWGSTSMARSTSNLGLTPAIPEEQVQGKGKAPAQDFAGFNPLTEPTSTLNTETREQHEQSPTIPPTSATENAQRYLEESRAHLQPAASSPIPTPSPRSPHFRQLSNASSAASSYVDSMPGSFRADSNLLSGGGGGSGLDVSLTGQDAGTPLTGGGATPSTEPMFNFRSLATMVNEDKAAVSEKSEHIEHVEQLSRAEEELKEPSPTGSPRVGSVVGLEGNRSRGDSGESSGSGGGGGGAPPPVYVERRSQEEEGGTDDGEDRITPVPPPPKVDVGVQVQHPHPHPQHHDEKTDFGAVNVLDHHGHGHVRATHEAMQ